MTTNLLFAYGTLAPADLNVAERCGWVADRIRGRLFELTHYPALVALNDPAAGWVSGFVRQVEPEEFARLDLYEGVDEGLYRREITTTQSGRQAWVYVYAPPLPPEARGPIERWEGPRVDPGQKCSDASNPS
jgi:gamma-glutamylcyclotransferase (GGCT)/AIG2-like uncharacterized protein YtfP